MHSFKLAVHLFNMTFLNSIQVVPKIQQTKIIINVITITKILIFLFTLIGLGIVFDYDSESFSKHLKKICL